MADNYLEKKYEQLRQGRPVIRKVNPSLDSLLTAAASSAQEDPSYTVGAAQLKAAASSARRLGIEFSEAISGTEPAVMEIRCAGMFELGQVLTAFRLKLAELHLYAETHPLADGAGVRLKVFRPAK